jgi:hypothetical protein
LETKNSGFMAIANKPAVTVSNDAAQALAIVIKDDN